MTILVATSANKRNNRKLMRFYLFAYHMMSTIQAVSDTFLRDTLFFIQKLCIF